MNEIKIIAKSAPILSNMLSKYDAGYKNMELQLIKDFVSEQDYKDVETMIKEYEEDIRAVHTPLVNDNNETLEISIEYLLKDRFYKIFEDTCKFAEYIANLENKRIKVIIHNSYDKKTWDFSQLLEEKIGPSIKRVLDKYQNVDIALENSWVLNDEAMGFRNCFDMSDVSYAVKVLNEICDNKFTTLLDTCHEMGTHEAFKRMTGNDLLNWDETFKMATMYSKLGHIHLNNMWDNGIDKDHGRPFDENHEGDLDKLKAIIEAYKKYADCDISIEIYEDDYNKEPLNLIKTTNSLRKLGYELKLD